MEQMGRKHVTMEMWAEAGSFDKAANPGDTVDESIVEHFVNCLPPLVLRSDYFQCSEPVKHCFDKERNWYAPAYATFIKKDGVWVYAGECFRFSAKYQEDSPPMASLSVANKRTI